MTDEFAMRGCRCRLFIMPSGGGAATAETLVKFTVRMIESGPAAGALIAAKYGRLTGDTELIAFDMGGTTAKLAMITRADGCRPWTL